MTSDKKTDLLTTQEVADALNVSRRRVLALIASGRLKSTQFGQIHLIHRKDVETVRERKTGRPGKES